ncbi:MAG: hypothetical protein K1V78_05450 [Muribaculaceae bacterium]
MLSFLNPEWWQRLRHRRGFGVHSPSAYRFITEVLNERLPYYGYERLDSLDADPHLARLLFRVLVATGPRRVGILCADPARRIILEDITKAALPHAGLFASSGSSDFVIVDSDSGEEFPGRLGSKGAFIIDSDRRRRRRSLDGLTSGSSFDNGRGIAVVTINSGIPRQHFNVKF